jgi:hypothetical protein
VELRKRQTSNYLRDSVGQKINFTPSPQVVCPDPEILAIMRLFLEKYEVLASADREMYSKAISSFANPPLVFKSEDK